MPGEVPARDRGDDEVPPAPRPAAPLTVPSPTVPPLTVLRGADLRRWARLVASRLDAARAELDALNVFPVPDGDTGTNLALTVGGAVADGGDDLARALLVHARGSSGVIASQLVRGWADVLVVRGPGVGAGAGAGVGPAEVAKALRRGDELAWAAVTDPVEGTVLSVSRAAADAAERAAARGDDLVGVVTAVVAAAGQALDRTPSQLPALAAAGVVDAGGAGLLLALHALRDVVTGDAGDVGDAGGTGATVPAVHLSALGQAGTDLDPTGPAYEVMYLLAVDDDARAEGLRRELQTLGDSVLVVGGGGLWHVHVHVDDPGAAVEAALACGRPRTIRITHFAAARAEADGRAEPAPPPPEPVDVPTTALAVVACAAGAATEELCRDAGAAVVPSGPGARASTGDVLDAVLAAGASARRVLVLPNDDESAAVAHQAGLAAEEQGVTAVVARSRSQVQVLAALAVLEPRAVDEDAVSALRSAAAAVEGCRHGAVAVAARATATPVGPCRPGDLVGTLGREVVAVGTDAAEVAVQVVARLGSGVERVTVLPGLDGAGAAEGLRARLAGSGVQVDVLGGGQPRYLLLLGCE